MAAIADLKKDEEVISGTMTTALACYSTVFSWFAWRVTPRNYLLMACHMTNASAQIVQGGRFVVSMATRGPARNEGAMWNGVSQTCADAAALCFSLAVLHGQNYHYMGGKDKRSEAKGGSGQLPTASV